MPKSTITEQVAAHLREEIRRGRWKAVMPGKDRLARELEVSPRTVQRALKVLEGDGTLEAQGGGRRRKVVAREAEAEAEIRPLLVRILTYERSDEGLVHHVHLQGELQKAGHTTHFTAKSLQDLGNPLFPALRSGHRLFQRPSHRKQIPSSGQQFARNSPETAQRRLEARAQRQR